MTGDGGRYSPRNEWTAAVLGSDGDVQAVLGTAVLLDERRLLTCRHVVAGRGELWVQFPMAAGAPTRRIAGVRCSDDRYDLAVLSLADPVPEVTPAPLGFPEPEELRESAWGAFGFRDGDPLGDSADGTIGAALAFGFVRLDTESRYRLREGFSGSGLWSAEHGAVVAVIVEASSTGDGRAITMYQADRCFPEEKLRVPGPAPAPATSSRWGWNLGDDPEGAGHWSPRARGVMVDDEGDRFRGRTAALRRIVAWLDRDRTDHKTLVVTGTPGVGKSAVLGRIVTTADSLIRARLPDGDAVRATEGSVACAVHAKGKTALEVAIEIARAARAEPPDQPYGLVPAIRAAGGRRPAGRFNVIIDAVDEATNSAEAKAIIEQVVLRLLRHCAREGVQVVLGSRRRVGGVSLVEHLLRDAAVVIDLDDPEYFAFEDLEEYALATLRLQGSDERTDNPYADERSARPVAARIAELSGQNFLITGMTAMSHGLYDESPVDPAALTFTHDVGKALDEYMERLPGVGGLSAAQLLTVLAFAESPGLPLELWCVAVEALTGVRLTVWDLSLFVAQSAADFIVQSMDQDSHRVFQLFHEALNDALLAERAQVVPAAEDERALTRAFITYGRDAGWDAAPSYLLRSLPDHAERAGLLDALLRDDAYLLHADLRRLSPLADAARTDAGRNRAQLLARTPYARAAAPPARRAMFSITEALEDLGRGYRSGPAPYRARWASTLTHRQRVALDGHTGGVWAVTTLVLGGRPLLASAGEDEVIRVWDPADGRQVHAMEGHAGCVFGLAVFAGGDGRPLLASAAADGLVRTWDPAAGRQVGVIEGHIGPVHDVCALTGPGGRSLLASAGADATVRIWDPRTAEEIQVLSGHSGGVASVCAVAVEGRSLLASCGLDGLWIWEPAAGGEYREMRHTAAGGWSVSAFGADDGRAMLAVTGDNVISLWDAATGHRTRTLDGHVGAVWTASAFRAPDGRTLLASTGDDERVLIWDPETGDRIRQVEGNIGGGYAVCPFTLGDRTLLACAGAAAMWVLDPATGESHPALPLGASAAWSMSTFTGPDGRTLLASSGGAKGVVRVWDPLTGEPLATLGGNARALWSVCTFTDPHERVLIAAAGADALVQVWASDTGARVGEFRSGTGSLWSICVFTAGGRTVLAAGGTEGVIRLWDPLTGTLVRELTGHTSTVWWQCSFVQDDRLVLASASNDGLLILWDPLSGERHHTLTAHQGGVWSVCEIDLDGRPAVVSGGADATVRIWDPATGTKLRTLRGHTGGVWSVCVLPSRGGRQLLVSSADDAVVRVWDPMTGEALHVIPVHLLPLVVADGAGLLIAGLSAGLLAIEIAGPGADAGAARGTVETASADL